MLRQNARRLLEMERALLHWKTSTVPSVKNAAVESAMHK